jgi:hypothetical protein
MTTKADTDSEEAEKRVRDIRRATRRGASGPLPRRVDAGHTGRLWRTTARL